MVWLSGIVTQYPYLWIDSFNPLIHGVFCPLLIFRQPIPKNSWLFTTFGCGNPYEQQFLFTPSDSTFFWTPGTKIFLFFCHLLYKSSGIQYLKICDLTQYFFAETPMEKKNSFRTPNTKFALIKKIFYKP